MIIEDNVVISMQTTFITHQDLNKSELKNIFPAEVDFGAKKLFFVFVCFFHLLPSKPLFLIKIWTALESAEQRPSRTAPFLSKSEKLDC